MDIHVFNQLAINFKNIHFEQKLMINDIEKQGMLKNIKIIVCIK